METKSSLYQQKKLRGRFAHQPVEVLSHPSVTRLSHTAFRVLILLSGQFSGKNNGALGITADQARELGIKSETTLYAALKKLEEAGLIEPTRPASRVPPRPTLYALAWRPLDDTKHTTATRTPSHAYRTKN